MLRFDLLQQHDTMLNDVRGNMTLHKRSDTITKRYCVKLWHERKCYGSIRNETEDNQDDSGPNSWFPLEAWLNILPGFSVLRVILNSLKRAQCLLSDNLMCGGDAEDGGSRSLGRLPDLWEWIPGFENSLHLLRVVWPIRGLFDKFSKPKRFFSTKPFLSGSWGLKMMLVTPGTLARSNPVLQKRCVYIRWARLTRARDLCQFGGMAELILA